MYSSVGAMCLLSLVVALNATPSFDWGDWGGQEWEGLRGQDADAVFFMWHTRTFSTEGYLYYFFYNKTTAITRSAMW